MLVVKYKSDSDVSTGVYEKDYQVGDGKISSNVWLFFGKESDLVIKVSGPELEKIKDQFLNIPMSTQPVVRWTGEMTNFIIDNIIL